MVVDLKLTDKFSSLSIIVLQIDYITRCLRNYSLQILKYINDMKIRGLMGFICIAVLQALWPVCAELRVKMQWRKLQNHFPKILLRVFFIGLGIVIYLCFSDYIDSIIANGIDYTISEVAFVFYWLYFSIRVCVIHLLCYFSMNQLKILWLIVPCQA